MLNVQHNNKRSTPDTFCQSQGQKRRRSTISTSAVSGDKFRLDDDRRSAMDYGLDQQHIQSKNPSECFHHLYEGNDLVAHNYPDMWTIDTSSNDSPTPGENNVIMVNVCYGALVVEMTTTFVAEYMDHVQPLELEGFGEMIKATYQDSTKFAGFINRPGLRQLIDDGAVEAHASLMVSPKPMTISSKPPKKQNTEATQDSIVRIAIYGTREDQHRIGKLCSASQLFLQHPFIEECGELEYSNPHYLLRPGGTMPQLQSAPELESAQVAVSSSLNELNKNRIMRIFDSTLDTHDPQVNLETCISNRLISTLKHHQVTAVAMMAEREYSSLGPYKFPSMWEKIDHSVPSRRFRNTVTGAYTQSPGLLRGGLLADDMGLGKTLSTLALVCLSLDLQSDNEHVASTTLVVTTKSTLPEWHYQIDKHIYRDQLRVALYHGADREALAQSLNYHDIVFTTYETLRADFEARGPLHQNKWRRLVLDEAHHIRNRSSQTFLAACSIPSTYRWCLTGTPIHNSLDDYGALLSFLCIPDLTEKTTFDRHITKPIQSQKQEGFLALQALVRATCIRRTKESMGAALNLPQREERIEYIPLNTKDQKLYDFFKTRTAEIASGKSKSNTATVPEQTKNRNILGLLNFLRLICNHGQDLLPDSAVAIWNDQDRNATGSCGGMTDVRDSALPPCSSKLDALFRNLMSSQDLALDQPQQLPAKSVVFSFWTKMLDLIQRAFVFHGIRFCRIDGGSSLEDRRNSLAVFNDDPYCTVMLATIGSAGEGLDLTAANHVHLMEPHWNPMAEAQAVDRVYRIGQERKVFITRYIVPNSIETYIQWIQQQKMKLVSQFTDTEKMSQAQIDLERWEQLRINLGCPATTE